MSSMNVIVLVGNLTRDPELSHVGDKQTPVCKFGMATSRSYKGEDKPCFIDVTCWSKTAEAVEQYCNKGDRVAINGRLEYDTWEKDGQKRSKHYVVANEVKFLTSKREKAENADVVSSEARDEAVPY